MRGAYENDWKKAFESASMSPSEALWDSISSSMDQRHGKRNWVTILLIAATVSLAFAFPLTIGNSSFELRPNNFEVTENSDPTQPLNLTTQTIEPEVITLAEVTNDERTIKTKPTNQNIIGSISARDLPTLAPKSENYNSEVRRLTINDIDLAGSGDQSLLLDYDLIPFFKPLKNELERGVLAAASLGSGNRSISSGANSMDLGLANADFELSAPNNDQSTVRSEEGGTTYRLGIGAELPIGKKWSLQSGVGYMVQRAPGISNAVFDDNGTYLPLGTYSAIEPGTVFLSTTYNYTAVNSYLNIPVVVKYPIIDKRLKLRLGAGISPELMISNSITTQEYGNVKNQINNTEYNPFGLSGILNLDLRFNLQGSYALAIESGIRKGFTSINGSGSKYPTSFNFGVVLFYQFE